jgi:hypothetical protein
MTLGIQYFLNGVLYTDDGYWIFVNVVSCSLSHNEGSCELIGVSNDFILYSLNQG